MFNIIKSDLYKFFKSKTFYISLLVAIIFATLTVVGNYIFAQEVASNGAGTMPGALLLQTGRDFLFYAFNSTMTVMLISVMISIFIASEYSSGIIKDTVSSGKPRTLIFSSKIIVGSISAIIFFGIVILFQALLGTALAGYGQALDISEIGLILSTFGTVSLILIALTTIFTLFATLLKSLGASLAVNLGIIMFSQLVLYLISLISNIFENIGDYWLLNNLDKIVSNALANTYEIKHIIIALSYTAIAFIIGASIFKKQDIK